MRPRELVIGAGRVPLEVVLSKAEPDCVTQGGDLEVSVFATSRTGHWLTVHPVFRHLRLPGRFWPSLDSACFAGVMGPNLVPKSATYK